MEKQIRITIFWIIGIITILSINSLAQSSEVKRYPSVTFRKVHGDDRWTSASQGCHRNELETITTPRPIRAKVFDMYDLNGGSLEAGDIVQIKCDDKFWSAANDGDIVFIEQTPNEKSSTEIKIKSIIKRYRNEQDNTTRLWVYLQTKNGNIISIPKEGQLTAASLTQDDEDDIIELAIYDRYKDPDRQVNNPLPPTNSLVCPNGPGYVVIFRETFGETAGAYVEFTNRKIGKTGNKVYVESPLIPYTYAIAFQKAASSAGVTSQFINSPFAPSVRVCGLENDFIINKGILVTSQAF